MSFKSQDSCNKWALMKIEAIQEANLWIEARSWPRGYICAMRLLVRHVSKSTLLEVLHWAASNAFLTQIKRNPCCWLLWLSHLIRERTRRFRIWHKTTGFLLACTDSVVVISFVMKHLIRNWGADLQLYEAEKNDLRLETDQLKPIPRSLRSLYLLHCSGRITPYSDSKYKKDPLFRTDDIIVQCTEQGKAWPV